MPATAYSVESSTRAYPFSGQDVRDLKRALARQRAATEHYGLDDLERLVARLPENGGEVELDSLFELIAVPAAARQFAEGEPAAQRLEALWERHLATRDRDVERNPPAVNELRYLQSDVSELTDWASWTCKTPYTCWALVEGEQDEDVPEEMVVRLRQLVAEAQGLWVWPGDVLGYWQAPAQVFVPLDDWRAHVAKDGWPAQDLDQARWLQEAFGLTPDECQLGVLARARTEETTRRAYEGALAGAKRPRPLPAEEPLLADADADASLDVRR